MKTISFLLLSFICSIVTLSAVPDDSFKPMQLKVPDHISNNELRAKIREVTKSAIESFIAENQSRKGARVAFFPCVTDVDSLATEQLAALLATKGKNSGFKVTAPSQIRTKALQVMKEGLQQDGLVDPESVKKIGQIIQADVIVIPKLKLIPDNNKLLGVEISFAPYEVATALQLPGGLVDPVYIKPKQSFMEEHGTKVYIGVAVFVLLLIVKVIFGVVKGASRPR